jgi:predicted nucleic-acid-binding protein
MTADCVLDTSILIRHFTQDDAVLAPRATAFLLRAATGAIALFLPDAVVFETVFTLQRPYRVPREHIAAQLLAILDMNQVTCPSRATFRDVFELYVARPSLSFVDCYLAVIAVTSGINCLATFDRSLGSVPGVRHVEPPHMTEPQ